LLNKDDTGLMEDQSTESAAVKTGGNAMDLRAALDGRLSRKEIFDRDSDVQASNAVQSV
jgi:hypothetical protein